jgi:hypothetical protein
MTLAKKIKIIVLSIIALVYFVYLYEFQDAANMGMRQWLQIILLEVPIGLILHYIKGYKKNNVIDT